MAFADNQISRSGWDLCAYTFQHEQTREMGSELNTKYQQSIIKSFPFHNVHICRMVSAINSETIFWIPGWRELYPEEWYRSIFWSKFGGWHPIWSFPSLMRRSVRYLMSRLPDNILISCRPNNQSCKMKCSKNITWRGGWTKSIQAPQAGGCASDHIYMQFPKLSFHMVKTRYLAYTMCCLHKLSQFRLSRHFLSLVAGMDGERAEFN